MRLVSLVKNHNNKDIPNQVQARKDTRATKINNLIIKLTIVQLKLLAECHYQISMKSVIISSQQEV